ncbi:alpha/beta hydrolase [uncultured Mameliella sp.]|uniref:alpha/beta fold hydrolase n=1 Tax=uncultured Mameliella sp. TaxID=1447087 RepID=UPI002630C4A7|nr:alpha/beta hydrolase [uncultured Mameliella sp.]
MTVEVPGRIRTVANGEARIAYAVSGPEDPGAVTLCLVASTGRGPGDFAHLAACLAKAGLRVVLPWPRGTGGSTGALEGIDFHDLAADAGAALESEAGPGGAVIVGHAYGCWIARTLAQDRPDLVDGIVLLAAGGGKWAPELSRAIEIAMDREAPEADRLAALQLGFFAEGHDPRPWLSGWSGKLVHAQRAARTATDRDSWWPSGRAPILDVVGLQDPFRPADGRDFYLHKFAPRVELVTVDGASHALPDEKPAEVAAIMVPWIRALRAGTPD